MGMGAGTVASAVLWRLLDSPADDECPKGPVIEVLFLATCEEYRECGQALALVRELEAAAKAMGCSAVAVAAVPVQGVGFWTDAVGCEVLVPLNGQHNDIDPPPDSVLGEPRNALGAFL